MYNNNRNFSEDEWEIGEENKVVANLADIAYGMASRENVRVEQIGPFRLSFIVEEDICKKMSLEKITEIIEEINKKSGEKVMIGGSNSPLSEKSPNIHSDLDIYIVVDYDNEENNEKVIKKIMRTIHENNWHEFISLGVISSKWLKLPYFAECLDPLNINDKKWWFSSKEECSEEYNKRLKESMEYLKKLKREDIIKQIKSIYNINILENNILKITTTPRWKSITDYKINRLKSIIE